MRNPSPAGVKRAGLSGTALVLLAALAAGCTTASEPPVGNPMLAYDADLRHPILISNEPEVFDLPVGMRGPALSPELEVALRDYVRSYKANGTGGITIQVPTGAANDVAVASTGHAVHYALVRAGVPRGNIQVAPYEVGDHSAPATLRLSYLRVKASVPSCGIWPDGGLASGSNAQVHNLGCASQQNLAAMVANPADLVRPRTMTPANGTRRSAVVKTYATIGNPGWEPEPAGDLLSRSIGGN